ncbi:hypothetical protein [Crateriforma conspicua]|uniref:hypothetical protein n=1 Tax=Crateriforma conspicua TaxID=2527996 RepID=UPI0011A324A4|nr:hypothetical protein [Crateriforma conspicua]
MNANDGQRPGAVPGTHWRIDGPHVADALPDGQARKSAGSDQSRPGDLSDIALSDWGLGDAGPGRIESTQRSIDDDVSIDDGAFIDADRHVAGDGPRLTAEDALRLHATDLVTRLQAWADRLDAREADLNVRQAELDRRERRVDSMTRQAAMAAAVTSPQPTIDAALSPTFQTAGDRSCAAAARRVAFALGHFGRSR